MIKAAIFDLDGTIGDTVESIAYSGNRALRDIGYQAFPVENYKYYAGDGVDELVRRTLRDSGDTNCSQFEQMKSIYKAYFAKDCMYHVKPFPGICEMLSELKKRGIRIAVLSNKPHAQAIDVVESLFGKDYFDELLERIREIRASERRAYQKITDVFEQCSYDYDKNSETTKNFYAFVQNKLHFAVTGKTAAELIYERADSKKPAMGLTTWKDAPNGKVLKRDIGIAKNYLNEKELSRLNRLVTMFIDYAELMAEDEILMSMQDWVNQTNQFLINNRRKVLSGKGYISHDTAIEKASKEYEVFRVKQDQEYVSEFDREVEKYLKGEGV